MRQRPPTPLPLPTRGRGGEGAAMWVLAVGNPCANGWVCVPPIPLVGRHTTDKGCER
jgi:hypothetical protein